MAKLGIGLSIVGVIAIFLPANLSDGYPIINRAMAGEFGLAMLLALCAAKYFATCLSLGSGAPGGVFGPTFSSARWRAERSSESRCCLSRI